MANLVKPFENIRKNSKLFFIKNNPLVVYAHYSAA